MHRYLVSWSDCTSMISLENYASTDDLISVSVVRESVNDMKVSASTTMLWNFLNFESSRLFTLHDVMMLDLSQSICLVHLFHNSPILSPCLTLVLSVAVYLDYWDASISRSTKFHDTHTVAMC